VDQPDFAAGVTGSVALVAELCQDGRIAPAIELASRLAGAARQRGFPGVAKAASRLETMLTIGAGIEDVEESLAELRRQAGLAGNDA
jgi:hypothetical protein